LVAAGGCTNVQSSGVQTGPGGHAPHQGAVALGATQVPAGAVEVGLVQAIGHDVPMDQIAPEFAARVASLGGNFGLVEQIATSYEMVTTMQSYTYSCGTTQQPRTCTGTRPVTTEVSTTQMLGRAFRVEGLAP
jgi:hypothetical protein